MGNVCTSEIAVDEFKTKKLKPIKIPARRYSDNGEKLNSRKDVSVQEFRDSFEKEGSPFH
jgi:hypothetical protein